MVQHPTFYLIRFFLLLFSPKVKLKETASFLDCSHNITSKPHVLASNLSSVLSLHLSSLHLFSVFASLGLCIIHPCIPQPLLVFYFNISLWLQHTSQICAASTSLIWDKSSPIPSMWHSIKGNTFYHLNPMLK